MGLVSQAVYNGGGHVLGYPIYLSCFLSLALASIVEDVLLLCFFFLNVFCVQDNS